MNNLLYVPSIGFIPLDKIYQIKDLDNKTLLIQYNETASDLTKSDYEIMFNKQPRFCDIYLNFKKKEDFDTAFNLLLNNNTNKLNVYLSRFNYTASGGHCELYVEE